MKKRIIGATLFTVVCALLISNVVGVLMFRSREMDAARNTLQELLTLMDAQSAITEPEELLRQFSQAAPDKRLTIIDTDGTVLADSEADVSAMEDHEDRPEVMEAEATGWGEAVRQSDTVGTSMLYVAKRFADNMVGRAAMPVSSINSLALGSVEAGEQIGHRGVLPVEHLFLPLYQNPQMFSTSSEKSIRSPMAEDWHTKNREEGCRHSN